MRKFWSIINTLTAQKPRSNVPDIVEVDNVKIFDLEKIAEKFNDHFCSVGKKLAEKIDGLAPSDYVKYLKNSPHCSMYLRPTAPTEILNVT